MLVAAAATSQHHLMHQSMQHALQHVPLLAGTHRLLKADLLDALH
jgi:hypothetical protein